MCKDKLVFFLLKGKRKERDESEIICLIKEIVFWKFVNFVRTQIQVFIGFWTGEKCGTIWCFCSSNYVPNKSVWILSESYKYLYRGMQYKENCDESNKKRSWDASNRVSLDHTVNNRGQSSCSSAVSWESFARVFILKWFWAMCSNRTTILNKE